MNDTTKISSIDWVQVWTDEGSGDWRPKDRYSFSTYADNDGNVTSVQLIDLGDKYGPPATEAEMRSLEAQMETIKTIKWVVKNDDL